MLTSKTILASFVVIISCLTAEVGHAQPLPPGTLSDNQIEELCVEYLEIYLKELFKLSFDQFKVVIQLQDPLFLYCSGRHGFWTFGENTFSDASRELLRH